ncbi:hypothetical protein B0T20DRAFT_362293 [Sordaria brevicollis]|uniref:2EXR domain-containing protein n=1 Tax=Sordaria brevicollis TaxID=83679 RepID=A0AAE0P2S7_SORBR|nr:hypothetical protein B0T20DRAFT_362293 [Sordaria brevicollis]
MTTFHLFPQLPWELRAQIWEMAVEPRQVDVIVSSHFDDQYVYKDYSKFELWGPKIWASRTPRSTPPVLHACQEARNHLQRQKIYEQAFSITPAVVLKELHDTPKFRAWRYRKKSKGGAVANLDFNAEAERERRFDGDKIQRLRTGIRTDRFEDFEGEYLLDTFPNLKELHINCHTGDVENWVCHYDELDRMIGADNVWIIPFRTDPSTIKGPITLAKMRPLVHEIWRRQDEEWGRIPIEDGANTGLPLEEMGALVGE